MPKRPTKLAGPEIPDALGPLRTVLRSHPRLRLEDRVVQVEDILERLGWDRLSPAEMTREMRSDRLVRIELYLEGRAAIAIHVFDPADRDTAFLMDGQTRREPAADWLVLSDAALWAIYRTPRPEEAAALDRVSIDEGDAWPRLKQHLSRGSHTTRVAHKAGEYAIMKERIGRIAFEAFENNREYARDLARRLEAAGIVLPLSELREELDSLLRPPGWVPPGAVSSPGQSRPELVWRKDGDQGTEVERELMSWPPDATHIFTRRGCSSFIRHLPPKRTSVLLPGSYMRRQTGVSFSDYHRQLREEALASGLLKPDGDLLRVVGEIELETPSAAATFVAGTPVSGWHVWRDRSGRRMTRPTGGSSAKPLK